MKKKPILCLDFDGVIHSYASGWKGADVIPDPPVYGAIKFICDASDHFDVQIFSSRSHQPGGIEAMQKWLIKWFEKENDGVPVNLKAVITGMVSFPTSKPPAMVSIDDRGLTFTGEWPEIDDLLAFKPWNKA